MTNIKRLKLLGKITKIQSDKAAKSLSDVKMLLDKEMGRLDSLQKFQSEYASNLTCSKKISMTSMQANLYINFLNYIQTTIDQQAGYIVKVQDSFVKHKYKWHKVYQQNKTLHDYIDKINKEQELEKSKKEQKELDSMVIDHYANRK